MKKTTLLRGCALASAFIVLPLAHAQLAITNGDFETGAPDPGSSQADVAGWFDFDGTNFWENAWHLNTGASYNGTAMVALSATSSNTTLDGAGQNGYLYQSIGMADGAAELPLSFVWGGFTDTADLRDLGITFSILESDGSFVPDQNTDILGAGGITLIDQISRLELAVVPGQSFDELWTFDLSSAGSGELFLRINNYQSPGGSAAWVGVDNIHVIPEPQTYAMLMGFAGLAIVFLRRRRSLK